VGPNILRVARNVFSSEESQEIPAPPSFTDIFGEGKALRSEKVKCHDADILSAQERS
jgi:hypothetical protein